MKVYENKYSKVGQELEKKSSPSNLEGSRELIVYEPFLVRVDEMSSGQQWKNTQIAMEKWVN